jgi:hypothetical protein
MAGSAYILRNKERAMVIGWRAKIASLAAAGLLMGLVSCKEASNRGAPAPDEEQPHSSQGAKPDKPATAAVPPTENAGATPPPKVPERHSLRHEGAKPGAVKGADNAPAPSEDPAAALDNALEHLQTGNLAYSTPERMKMAETAHIVARIASSAISVDTLKAGMPSDAGTQVATEATSITPKMKMTLTSADFDITALSSAEQMVAGSTPTTWEWDIVAKHSGELRLHLAAVIELGKLSKDFTTVDREVAVKVDPVDAVGEFVKGNWQWIIATMTAVVGAVWRFFSARKKGQAEAKA